MLPFLTKIKNFLKKENNQTEYFLSLEIKENIIKTAVWKTVLDKSEVIGTGEEKTTQDWEDIIKNADTAISQASASIPAEKIKKTILGLPQYWIEEGKVKPEILNNLKKLCKNLELTPMGFIVITEALLAQVQKKEQAPLTCILLEIGHLYNIISVIRVGKIQLTQHLDAQSSSLCDQIVTILKNIPDRDVLPSRILLYDEDIDLEKIKQEIISYPWNQKASFLHFPKVESLPKEYDLEGVVLTSSKEIKNRFLPDEETKEVNKDETFMPANIIAPLQNANVSQNDFGFVEDLDILEIEQSKKEVIPESPPPVEEAPAILAVEEEQIIKEPIIISPTPPSVRFEDVEKVREEDEKKITSARPDIKKSLFARFMSLFSIFNFSSSGKQVVFIGMAIFILLSVSSLFAYYRFAKTTLTLYVVSETLEKETEIIIKAEGEKTNPDNKEIAGINLEITEEGSLNAKTTGEKLVGEKAKGEVTLYNKTTTGSKTFKSGTILIGPDDKEFILDSDTTIPVAASQLEGITFGKVKVKITAVDIGTEYNLPSGKKEFSVKEFPTSSYSAASDEAFTGGSSKKVRIVAAKDLDALSTSIAKKLTDKAKNDLLTKLSPGQKLISESIEKISQKDNFSQDEGDEAEEISVKSQIKFQVLSYNETDIKSIINKIAAKLISDEFEYDQTSLLINIKNIEKTVTKEGTNQLVVNVAFSIKLTPKINLADIRNKLSGKNPKFAKEYLSTLPNIGGYDLDFSPRLPKELLFFPRNPQNITIRIIPKK